jgi:uncharacterized protein
MNPKKQKQKDRRRARKLADEAWEAANAGNLDLALKIFRRAVEAQPDNPVLWNDLGVLLVRDGNDDEAERSFRAALSLAPDHAEACVHLAALCFREGRLAEAVSLQTRAVQLADAPGQADRLAAYRAAAGQIAAPVPYSSAPALTPAVEPGEGTTEDWTERLAELDWDVLGQRLTREGCLVLAGLLAADSCSLLRSWFDEDARFSKTVVMDRPDFGRGVYRYFRPPVPALVDALRRAVYPHAARIANAWQQLLGEPTLFPEQWEDFREVCRAAGQATPTPILLRYEPGGFNALHRDLRGPVYFPLQLAVVLSPRSADGAGEGFSGGEFLLRDVPEREKSQRRSLPAGLGDAILFCTRDRLVRVGGAYGLQPVMHGAALVSGADRCVLGLPFHEYR